MRYKISFCTVCMNRLKHLRQTMIKNLQDNADYEELEFILLDYNSSDGLKEYVQSELMDYIRTGRLKYYSTNDPLFFHRSHSRNLVFKLAEGELICNIDADNYTGKGFASYINAEFQNDHLTFLNTIGANIKCKFKKDVLGRICVRKSDFIDIAGYDESMQNYGFEDFDFANRLEMNGIKRKPIEESNFLLAVPHSDTERIDQEYVKKSLFTLMTRYIEPSLTELVLLLSDKRFYRGTIIENYSTNSSFPACSDKFAFYEYRYSLLGGKWDSGYWELKEGNIIFDDDASIALIQRQNGTYSSSLFLPMNSYYLIRDEALIDEALFFFQPGYQQNKNGNKQKKWVKDRKRKGVWIWNCIPEFRISKPYYCLSYGQINR